MASRGPKGWVRPDERIRDELCERLARSALDARELEVTVERGEVRLGGALADEAELRFAVALAERVLGVRAVHAEVLLRDEPEEVEDEPTPTWH